MSEPRVDAFVRLAKSGAAWRIDAVFQFANGRRVPHLVGVGVNRGHLARWASFDELTEVSP